MAVDGGVVGSAEEDEAEMTSSMACAIAASSASALGKQTWPGPPCRTKGSGGRGWGGGAACRSTEDGAVVVAAGVTATVRWSDVEPAGLPTETDGREDDGDDGRVGGSWSSSSSSDCWKKSSEKTCCKVDSRLIGDPPPLAAVDMPISISPLSHPMNAAIFASQFPRNR